LSFSIEVSVRRVTLTTATGARNKLWAFGIPIGLIRLQSPEEERLVFHQVQQCFTNLTCSGADNPSLLVLKSIDHAVGVHGQNDRFAVHSFSGAAVGGPQPDLFIVYSVMVDRQIHALSCHSITTRILSTTAYGDVF